MSGEGDARGWHGGLLILTALSVLGGAGVGSPLPASSIAAELKQPDHTVTGTLALLDLSTRKGMIKTDLDKPIFFDISRPDLFARLSVGERITVQLDDEGRAIKVIEALPSELHEPPPAPKQ